MRTPRRPRLPLDRRFWSKVQKTDGCWLWRGARQDRGLYGTIVADHTCTKKLYAHRVSWELHYGDIPNGMNVLHRCDNKICVNPSHLFLGTSQDNVADMVVKKRHAIGERNGCAKLTDDLVRGVLDYLADGITVKATAKVFGVSVSAIEAIKYKKYWRHITEAA